MLNLLDSCDILGRPTYLLICTMECLRKLLLCTSWVFCMYLDIFNQHFTAILNLPIGYRHCRALEVHTVYRCTSEAPKLTRGPWDFVTQLLLPICSIIILTYLGLSLFKSFIKTFSWSCRYSQNIVRHYRNGDNIIDMEDTMQLFKRYKLCQWYH